MKKISVTILGAGNMGTALSCVIAQSGHSVTLWNYEGDPEPLDQIESIRENAVYLPGVAIPPSVSVERDIGRAVRNACLVILAVPSAVTKATFQRCVPYLKKGIIVVDVSKGVEDVLFEKNDKLPRRAKREERLWHERVMLSGPAVASELARGAFTAMEAVSRRISNARAVCEVLGHEALRLVPTADVRGVKICGALKNCYAILLGALDAQGVSLNTKAYLVTKIIAEMSALVVGAGGKEATVMGPAGLGDLIGTGFSPLSRNRRFGEYLGRYLDRERAEREVGQVVEGLHAIAALKRLLRFRFKRFPLLSFVDRFISSPDSFPHLVDEILGLR